MARKKGRKLEAGELIRRHLREPEVTQTDPEEDLAALTRQAATEKLAAATRTAARHGIAEEVLIQLVRREHRATTSKLQKKSLASTTPRTEQPHETIMRLCYRGGGHQKGTIRAIESAERQLTSQARGARSGHTAAEEKWKEVARKHLRAHAAKKKIAANKRQTAKVRRTLKRRG